MAVFRLLSACTLLIATAAALADDSPAPAVDTSPRAELAPPPAPVASTAAPGATAPSDASRAPARSQVPAGGAHDTLVLDPTAITGNRELPKVMVIVPWKKSEIGDLAGKPPNSLVDEILQPVDRDEFRREIKYHSVLSPDRARNETAVTPAAPAGRPDR